MTITRPATACDLAAIAALEAEIYPPEQRWDLEDYTDLFQTPGSWFIVAHDGSVLAYAVAAPAANHLTAATHIVALTVAPEHRGAGLAREMLSALLAATPAPHVLEVGIDNVPALTLYRSLGFLDVEELPDHYAPSSPALVMIRP